jgi:hypothetical protein
LEVQVPGSKTLSFFIPPWRTLKEPKVSYNGKVGEVTSSNGFVEIAAYFAAGDIVELEFGVGLHVEKTHNPNSVEGVHSFRHGPLLLVLDQSPSESCECGHPTEPATIDMLPSGTKFEYLGKGRYKSLKDEQVVLTPVYNIEELIQPWHARQGLFFSDHR